jgi:hypothetical protein
MFVYDGDSAGVVGNLVLSVVEAPGSVAPVPGVSIRGKDGKQTRKSLCGWLDR